MRAVKQDTEQTLYNRVGMDADTHGWYKSGLEAHGLLMLGILTQPNTTTESCWELRRDGAWEHARVVAAQVVLGEDSPQKLCLVTVFRGVHRQKLAITYG